ncbi:Fibulin-1 [Fragariocoptes setiger]|uniref:Fibulin-1 n=1 Tax=Fragariocoptes setiger TaxID=1670756 RepID=A0ABQ7S663_9ACAR|nr:Fibulin-1 [Fragariocoptes setiger]
MMLLPTAAAAAAAAAKITKKTTIKLTNATCLLDQLITHNCLESPQLLLDRCCHIGKQRAIENAAFDCKMSARDALANMSVALELSISGTYADQCEMLLESCCMAHHRTRNCHAGKQFAHSGSGCMDVELSKQANVATESFNDCCMACSLGILASRQPVTGASPIVTRNSQQQLMARCKLISPLASSLSGQLYEQTYIDCCQQALPKSQVLNLLTPGSAVNCSQANACSQRCIEAGFYDTSTRQLVEHDRCDCFVGYKLAADGINCVDIDECAEQLHSCNRQAEICDNTRGAYRCLARDSVASSSSPSSHRDTCAFGFEWDIVVHQCVPVLSHKQPAMMQQDGLQQFHSSHHSHSHSSRSFASGATNLPSHSSQFHLSQSTFGTPDTGSGPTLSTHTQQLTVHKGSCNSGQQQHQNQCDTRTHRCVDLAFGKGYTCLKLITSNAAARSLLIRRKRFGEMEGTSGDTTTEEGEEVTSSAGETTTSTTTTSSSTEAPTSGDNKDEEIDNIDNSERDNALIGSVSPIGSGVFDCSADYRYDFNTRRCHKINICRPNPCKQGDTCLPFVTTTGEKSYKCQQQCPKGYRVVSLSLDAASGFGTGIRSNNVRSNTLCEDIDECRLGTNTCLAENHEICLNTDGSYVCRCETGFFKNSDGKCQDIDECAERGDMLCPPDTSRCVNKPGTYQCACKAGFRHEGDNTRLCVDIDECKEVERTCEHTCLNTYGSHKCLCRRGYRLADDGHSCQDIDECKLYGNHSLSGVGGASANGQPISERTCVGVCINLPGSFQCQCPQGYRLSLDQTTCQDINECLEDPLRCGQDRVCFNTRGGFKCNTIICPDGYVKDIINRNKCKLNVKSKSKYQPISITYNYITFPSELDLQPKGSVELFTMRGPKNFDIDAKFELKLVSATKIGQPDVRTARRSDFSISEPDFNEGVVNMIRPIQGPQDIELDLELKLYSNKVLQSVQMAKLIIYVTLKPF